MKKKTESFEKEIKFLPAYDKRNADPNKNYGIHGVEMRWYLKGKMGVAQFVVFTNWHLPHVEKELLAKCHVRDNYCTLKPMPADVGYHSPKAMYENQSVCVEECEVLGGKPCYYDGSGLYADTIFQLLVEKGSDAVWEKLEEYYNDIFYGNTP